MIRLPVIGTLLLLLSANALASSKTINEGVAATSNTVFIDTVNVRVGIGTKIPATKFHVTSGTLTVDGGTASINISTQPLASGVTAQFGSGGGALVGTNIQVVNNQNSANAGIATHNRTNVETVIFAESGAAGSVGTTSNHPLKFITNNTEAGRFGTNGDFNVATSTFTAGNNGIMTAPSQSGAMAGLIANKTFPKGVMNKIFWSSAAASMDPGLYNNQNTIDIAADSATFYVRGTGLYAWGCQVAFQNPGEATTLHVEMVFAGGAGAIVGKTRQPGINGYDSYVSVSGIKYMTAGQNVTCRMQSFATVTDPVVLGVSDGSASYAYIQKLW